MNKRVLLLFLSFLTSNVFAGGLDCSKLTAPTNPELDQQIAKLVELMSSPDANNEGIDSDRAIDGLKQFVESGSLNVISESTAIGLVKLTLASIPQIDKRTHKPVDLKRDPQQIVSEEVANIVSKNKLAFECAFQKGDLDSVHGQGNYRPTLSKEEIKAFTKQMAVVASDQNG